MPFIEASPDPRWVKKWVDGEDWARCCVVSPSYWRLFGVIWRQYPGKTDIEMCVTALGPELGERVARNWRVLDLRAIRNFPDPAFEYEVAFLPSGREVVVASTKQAARHMTEDAWLISGECKIVSDPKAIERAGLVS